MPVNAERAKTRKKKLGKTSAVPKNTAKTTGKTDSVSGQKRQLLSAFQHYSHLTRNAASCQIAAGLFSKQEPKEKQ